MALSVTVNAALSDFTSKTRVIRGTLTFSGSYPGSNGDTFDLTKFAGAPVKKNAPAIVGLWGVNGYGYGYVAGADLTAGKVKVTTAANTEHTTASYAAGVTGDTVNFEVVFPKV